MEPRAHDRTSDLQPLPKASLPGLPQELLLSITELLDVGDVGCLALSSHGLESKLLDQSVLLPLRATKDKNEQRVSFLQRLCKDHPEFFYCFACCKTQYRHHVRTPASPHVPDALPCTTLDYGMRPRWSNHTYDFSFQHLQLAMTRERLGLAHGIPLSQLGTTYIDDWRNAPSLHNNHAFHAEARVINGELCLRLQHVIILRADMLHWPYWRLGNLPICTHTSLPIDQVGNAATAWSMGRYQHGVSQPCNSSCERTRQCSECKAEFLFHLHDIGRGYMAATITIWLNLGKGETPDDVQWTRHLPPRSYESMSRSINLVSAEEESICGNFEWKLGKLAEDVAAQSLESLRFRMIQEVHPLRD